jgi:hypothetical protein
VFLEESEQNSCGPFFCMEIEKLRSSFGLRFIDVIVELRIGKVDNKGDDVHPLRHQLFDGIVNFIMSGFPQKFHHEVNELTISVSLSEEVEIREHLFKECEEEFPFIFGNTELEGCGDGYQNMHHGD